MKMQFIGAAASAVLAFSATQGLAATLVIDTFDVTQRVSDVPSAGFVTTSTVSGVGDLNADRTLTVQNTQSAGSSEDATDLRSAGGFLSFSNDSGAAGIGTITYEFASTSFLIGQSPYLSFGVESFDHDTWIEVIAFDGSGNSVSYSETLYVGFSPNLSLTQMAGDAGFSWGDVIALQFIVNSTSGETGLTTLDIDGRLTSITLETVPLPASGILLLGGVTGLAALRRRNKKSA